MPYDADVVREILRKLHDQVPDTGFVVANSGAMPPMAPVDREGRDIRAHWERLKELGWIEPGDPIRMRPPPDYGTYRATGQAHSWAQVAWDDAAWAERRNELLATLSPPQPE